ncbi:MAG: hypothetical protein IJU84_04500 [Clostridia bacterium]|nr:hypothetical protein [Clostridia bacterium]
MKVKSAVVFAAVLAALVFSSWGYGKNIVYGENMKSNAQLIVNEYARKDVLIADIICDEAHGYSVDNTGKNPSAMAIQKAIDDCASFGGGTVYLPAGEYLVSSRIEIKPFVSLVGDYVDPDEYGGDYGTVIKAGVASTNNDAGEAHNLFRMDGSSGLIGLTFFYPDQYIDYVMPYAYAIEIPGGITTQMHTTFTIKNVTFINAYKGICASVTKHSTLSSVTHEQLYLENIKGTVLREGVHLTNSSEVGTFCDIEFSPSVWANAGKKYNAPAAKDISDYTSVNSVGMILGDLEWQEIRNVTLTDYHTGIYFTKGNRNTSYQMAFIGSFYNLNVTGAKYCLIVEEMYRNMGIQFASSVLEGEYAAVNRSPDDWGHVQLSGVKYNGKLSGKNIYDDNNLPTDLPAVVNFSADHVLPKMKLFNAVTGYGADNEGKTDTSRAIQDALDAANSNGGGIVYLPAGVYRLDNPLTVYANTQLRGCGSNIQRDLIGANDGTMLLCYYGATETPETSAAMITLAGDNAGVYGLRAVYPRLNMFAERYTAETLPKYSFTIRGTGKNNYAVNLYLTGVYNAVDFSACDNCVINRVIGGFYNAGFYIGGKDPVVYNCLQNSICPLKVSVPSSADISSWGTYQERLEKLHTNLYDLTRQTAKIITAKNAENAQIHNVFSFASNKFITAYNSTLVCSNLGMDSQPGDGGAMFELHGSSAICFNTLRDACSKVGNYYTEDSSSLTVYNRITLLPSAGTVNESNLDKNVAYGSSKNNTEADDDVKIWNEPAVNTYSGGSDAAPSSPRQSGEGKSSGCSGGIGSACGAAAALAGAAAVRKKRKDK